MSDGTCDQLYFALRLATLEQHLSTADPMIFVVDDVLINFDEPRTAAALQVLAEVASRTQVLLFTHHQHVVTLARALSHPSGIFVHTLQA